VIYQNIARAYVVVNVLAGDRASAIVRAYARAIVSYERN
jgi:hypothetical protein